jgi:polysaccharide export outer membrane protein
MKARPRSQSRITAMHSTLRLLRTSLTMIFIAPAALALNACVPSNNIMPEASTSGAVSGDPTRVGQPIDKSVSGYKIGPEDVLFISVWKEPDLEREVKVRPDGGISFPLAGDVDVAGKTVQQVTDIITQRVQRYIPAAVVTVSVQEVAGYTIYVIGQVNNPGKFTLGSYVDVVQALTLAGGLTPFANADAITIRRREGNREIVLPFDYGAVAAGNGNGQNIVLQSGDTVVVP